MIQIDIKHVFLDEFRQKYYLLQFLKIISENVDILIYKARPNGKFTVFNSLIEM